jgi:sortase A
VSLIRDTTRRASRIVFAAGVLLLAYAAYVLVDERLYQARELNRLDHERQVVLDAAAEIPAPSLRVAVPPPTDGTSIGEIRIRRLGVSVVVVQGESEAILERAVGHLARTALPGNEGNVVLAGHRDTFFRPLKDIREGDRITLRTAEHDFEYVVESTSIVNPTDVGVIEPSGGHTLTLITCFPFYYVGPAPNRFVVLAREAE